MRKRFYSQNAYNEGNFDSALKEKMKEGRNKNEND